VPSTTDARKADSETFRSDLDDWFEPMADEPFDGEALTAALESLDGDIREIVIAKIWSNLTFREIAELTERPISSVHLDYQRGIERLRELLDGQR